MDDKEKIDIFTKQVWRLAITITAMKIAPADISQKLENEFASIIDSLLDIMKNNDDVVDRSLWEELFTFLSSLEDTSTVVKEYMFDRQVIGAAYNDIFEFICKTQMKLSHFNIYFKDNPDHGQEELQNIQDKLEYSLNKYLRMSQISKGTLEYTVLAIERYIEDLNNILDQINNISKETQKFSDIMEDMDLEENGDEI